MGIEFSQRETPTAAQRAATEHFTTWNHYAYSAWISLTLICAMFSGWAAFRLAGGDGAMDKLASLVFMLGAAFLCTCKSFVIIQWGTMRKQPARDFWLPLAQFLFFVSVLWSALAVMVFAFFTQNLAWSIVLAIAHVGATILPAFGVHGARTWEESDNREVYYATGAGAQPMIEAQPIERSIRRADQIIPEAIEWMWPGMIPAADFTIIGGESTAGKTTVCMSLAAAISAGGRLPDGTRAKQGVAAVIEAEDDVASVTRPRLEAAGADLTRVHVIEHSSGEILTPEILEEYATRIRGLRFLVLSPLRILMQDNQAPYQKIWSRLNPIVQWARARGVAIIGVMHPPKNSKDSLAGSDAYRSLARSILYADSDPDKPGIRRLKLLISNIAATPPAFPYRIVSADLGGIETSRIIWLNRRELDDGRRSGDLTIAGAAGGNIISFPASGDAYAAYATPARTGRIEMPSGHFNTAEEWLAALLKDGPLAFQTISEAGKAAHYSERTLYAAGKALGVRKLRGDGNRATWALP